jgi:hypothetical protein
LSQLFKRQYGGDIQAFLASNVQVIGSHPSAGTPAPTVPGIPSPTFVLLQGASESQPPPLVPDESIYGPSMPYNLNYPRVEDTFAVSPAKSLSPMETDPLILPPSPPPGNPTPIVGRVLSFDSKDDAAPLQPCSHPRGEDTCSMGIRPDSDDCMVDVPKSEGLGTSEDPTGLEAALRNSSLDSCKEVFPRRGSFDDDDDDGGEEHGEGGQTGDHARVTAVNYGGASGNPHLDSGDHSGHDGDEPVADKEGRMEDDLVDYDSDPYKSAMRGQPDAAADSIFRVERHSRDPSTPQDEVCFHIIPLYYIWLFVFFRFSFLSFLSGRFRSMPYIYRFNDRCSSSQRVGIVDVAAPSFIPELVFRVVAFECIVVMY